MFISSADQIKKIYLHTQRTFFLGFWKFQIVYDKQTNNDQIVLNSIKSHQTCEQDEGDNLLIFVVVFLNRSKTKLWHIDITHVIGSENHIL